MAVLLLFLKVFGVVLRFPYFASVLVWWHFVNHQAWLADGIVVVAVADVELQNGIAPRHGMEWIGRR
jgi:hypothetical protein